MDIKERKKNNNGGGGKKKEQGPDALLGESGGGADVLKARKGSATLELQGEEEGLIKIHPKGQ